MQKAYPETRLQHEREKRGLSQWKLAILAGVHPTVLSNIERRVVIPQPGHRRRIADALGAAIGELFGDFPERIELRGDR